MGTALDFGEAEGLRVHREIELTAEMGRSGRRDRNPALEQDQASIRQL
jgi:hypothetical protein